MLKITFISMESIRDKRQRLNRENIFKMQLNFKKIIGCFFIICIIPMTSFSQVECPEVPQQKYRATSSIKVKQNGRLLEKGDKITLPQVLPLYPDTDFFNCNNLEFDKGGELRFIYAMDGKLINLTYSYDDYIGKSRGFNHYSANGLTRSSFGMECFFSDNASSYAQSLLADEFKIQSQNCLKAFFNNERFEILNGNLLSLNYEDENPVRQILFVDEQGVEYRFEVDGKQLYLNPELMPTESLVSVYLLLTNDQKELLAEKMLFININGLAENFKKQKINKRKIKNLLYSNYLIAINKNLTKTDQRKLDSRVEELLNTL